MVLLLGLLACKTESTEEVRVPDPELTLESPAAAAWLPLGDVTAHGTCGNVEAVDLNGQAATFDLEDGTWEGRVSLNRGVNVIEARGVAPDGEYRYERHAVMSGDYADPGKPIEDAADLRVNQSGLDRPWTGPPGWSTSPPSPPPPPA